MSLSVDLWRELNIVLAVVSITMIVYRLVKHRDHWFPRERLFMLATLLLCITNFTASIEGLAQSLPFGLRVPLSTVANAWVIWSLLDPPERSGGDRR